MKISTKGTLMSLRNKKIVEKFVSEFVNRNYDSYMRFLDDDIRWNIVGMPPITGKQNFLEAMEMMDIWQSSSKRMYSPAGSRKNVIAEGEYVVIENQNSSLNNDIRHNPAHCDIYRINKGKIKEVTTYIVDTSTND